MKQSQRISLRRLALRALPEAPFDSSLSEPLVSQFSTRPIFFHVDEPIKAAAQRMIVSGVSSGPVLDDEGTMVGLLTESDMIWKASTPIDHFIIPPVFVGLFDLYFFLRDQPKFDSEVKKILASKVKDSMTTNVITVPADALLSEAAKIMMTNNVHSLPVMDLDGKRVQGMISRHGILLGLISSNNPLFA